MTCACGCGEALRTDRPKYRTPRFIPGHGHRKPLLAKFMAGMTPGEPGECWEWVGYKTSRGYGLISNLPGRRARRDQP